MKVILFANKYKNEEKHPDFKTSIQTEEGKWIDVGAAWLGKTKNGDQMMTVTLEKEGLKRYLDKQKNFSKPKPKPVDNVDPSDLPF